MITHIFALQSLFPELYSRTEKPVVDIPVLYDKEQISITSLNDRGEFSIVIPANIENRLLKNHWVFVPVYRELNHDPDPKKVKLRLTGIDVHILPHR